MILVKSFFFFSLLSCNTHPCTCSVTIELAKLPNRIFVANWMASKAASFWLWSLHLQLKLELQTCRWVVYDMYDSRIQAGSPSCRRISKKRDWDARLAHFFKEGVDWKCWFSMIFHDFFVIMHDLHNMGSCRKRVSLLDKWPLPTTAVVAYFFAREKETSTA